MMSQLDPPESSESFVRVCFLDLRISVFHYAKMRQDEFSGQESPIYDSVRILVYFAI